MNDTPPPDSRLWRFIGQPQRRKEDERLLRGEGRFTDDATAPRALHVAMVRSPYPHARIRALDTRAARTMPGVFGVFTGVDLAEDGLAPIPHNPLPSTRDDLQLRAPGGGEVFIGPHLLLPVDRARHVGEALAMVVAETREQALDAAEMVVADLEPLDWVADAATAATDPAAPAVWDEIPGNVCVDSWFGDVENTRAAFQRAPYVKRMRFHVDRVTGVPLEPRSALGSFDPATGRYTLHAGSGGAVRQKREIAAVLGIEPDRLRILSFDVGGNFGTRNRVYVEFALVLWAARRLARPVKYTATRSESFLTDYQGRDLHTEVALAMDADGRFLALHADNLSNLGARAVSLSPLGKGSALVTGSYAIEHGSVRARAVFTNTVPTQAYRSSGRPEVTYAIERTIDAAAREFGLDPIELRRKNFIRPDQMPYGNPLGARYDSGEYEHAMDLAMHRVDWAGFETRRAESEARGLLLGHGLAHYVESSIGSPRERAEVTVCAEGRVSVVIGTQPSGQGHETSFAQVTADLLGIEFEQVEIVLGDTDVVAVGGGSHSGRSMRHAATVISQAVTELTAKGLRAFAAIESVSDDEVSFEGGLFRSSRTNRSLDWFQLARACEEPGARQALDAHFGQEGFAGLAVSRTNEMHTPVYPNGCAACEVEVDPETGTVELTRYAAVDDVGRAINPLILHGQAHGSVAQGVGQALLEHCHVDAATGQPLTGSLMDYALPRAVDLPDLDTEIMEVLSPTNPLGIKSGGEGATTPSLAAVVNAILDALAPLGVKDIQMPATPFRVWQAIQRARERAC